MSNATLKNAQRNRNDEYYTLYSDIYDEVSHYKQYLTGKTVYCNCDDKTSMFRQFFHDQFHELGLKQLFCSGISGNYMEYDGRNSTEYRGDGDFRSSDSKVLLEKSDIVITNVPFSLFREYMAVVNGKDALIIGNKNAISYKEVFPLIQKGILRLGYTHPNFFATPSGSIANLTGLCRWFTTLPVSTISKVYADNDFNFKRFDFYPAVCVDKTSDIPGNYYGLMGVPITALDGFDYNSYEIVDLIARYAIINHQYDVKGNQLTEVDGKPKYSRLIIKKKKNIQNIKFNNTILYG